MADPSPAPPDAPTAAPGAHNGYRDRLGAWVRTPFGRWLLAVAGAGLVWRTFYILAFKRDPGVCAPSRLCGDAIYYNAQARTNVLGHFFEDPTHLGFPAADHPPLTALVLTPVSWVTTNSIVAQLLTMAVIGTVTVVIMGLLGRKLAGPVAGVVTAAVAAANPNLWMNDGLLMSESIAALGIAATLLGLYRFRERPVTARAALLGAIVGLTMLARAEMALFIPLAVLPVIVARRELTLVQRLGRFALVVVVAAAVILPWTAWNATRFRQPVLLSTNDGITLIGANCDITYYSTAIGFWNLDCASAADTTMTARDTLDQSEVSAVYRRQALDYINANRSHLPTVVWHRVLRTWSLEEPQQMVWLNQGEGRETWASWWGVWFLWLSLPFVVWGTRLLRQRQVAVWPLLSTAVIVIVTASAFYGIVRFRLPADVAFCALAGVALAEAGQRWWQDRRHRIDSRRLSDAARPRHPETVAPLVGAAAAGPTEAPDPPLDPGTAPGDPHFAKPATPEVSAGAHFPCLDAYRGIGMTMVLINHAAFSTGFIQRGMSGEGDRIESILGPILARTDLSVPMFFVMSGFLLFRPFAARALAGREPPAARRYFRRRILRVVPAYWVALVGIALIFGLRIDGITDWISNALVLPAFGAPGGYAITQAWSIGVEVTFYLMLPLFAWGVTRMTRGADQRRRRVILLAAIAALYVLGWVFRIYVVAASPSWQTQSLLWLPMYIDLFAIGMAMAVLSADLSHRRSLPRLVRSLGRHPALCWAAAAALYLIMTRFTPPPVPFGLNGAEYLPRQLLYGLASALWLWPAMFGDQTQGRLRRVLSSKPLVYLGGISLSFYLWHLALVEQAKYWTVPLYAWRTGLATFAGNLLQVAALAWLVTFLVASLLFRWVELPFLRLKDEPLRSLFGRNRAGRPTVGPRS